MLTISSSRHFIPILSHILLIKKIKNKNEKNNCQNIFHIMRMVRQENVVVICTHISTHICMVSGSFLAWLSRGGLTRQENQAYFSCRMTYVYI